ncbi:MAG: hypothetical protein Kow0029_13870 [Candidatus Rifleibacteriota bacterium]
MSNNAVRQIRHTEPIFRQKVLMLKESQPEQTEQINEAESVFNNALRKNDISGAKYAEKLLADIEAGTIYKKSQSESEKLAALTKAHEAQKFYIQPWRKGNA